MRKLAFWDWHYIALLQFLRKTQPVSNELYSLYHSFRPVGYEDQQSFCPFSPEQDTEDFEKLDRERKQLAFEKLASAYNTDLFDCPEHIPLQELKRYFALDEEMIKLTVFLFLYDRFEPFKAFFLKLGESQRLCLMEQFSGLGRNRLVEEMKTTGTLVACGILEEEGSSRLEISRYNIKITIASYLSQYLDDTHSSSLAYSLFKKVDQSSLPLSSFGLANEAILSTLSALKKPGPGIIVFYGEPGTGKTELSKRIVCDAGLKPLFLKKPKNQKWSFSILNAATKLTDPEQDVLIIDEADALLSTIGFFGDDDKAKQRFFINQFLDDYPKKIIFIVNSTINISHTTLRRMQVIIDFKPLNCEQRRKIWYEINDANPIFTQDEQRQLSVDFPSNPVRIQQVYAICSELTRSGESRERVFDIARDMLGRSAALFNKIPYRKKKSGESIDIGLLTASVSAEEMIERVKMWNESNEDTGEGLNLLFYGAPGTGKTAFAKYLVKNLGMPLIIKRASDLLDPYVGGTEQKLRAAFEEAKDCALVIDEADSFLTSRSSAVRSWERTQVNEFLTCMESFTGLFIATTNFTTLLDAACLRRFQQKVEFLVPDAAKRLRLAERFFSGIEWDSHSQECISAMDMLTPGDFSVVARRMQYSANVTASKVCVELALEKGFRKTGKIGF